MEQNHKYQNVSKSASEHTTMCCRIHTVDTHNNSNNHAYTPLNHFSSNLFILAFPPRCCISAFVFIVVAAAERPKLQFVLISNLKCVHTNIDFWNSAGARCKMHIEKSINLFEKSSTECSAAVFFLVSFCVSPPCLAITKILKIEITTTTASSYIFRK